MKMHYIKQVAGLVPRLLGCADRDRSSKTYGCFDRSYWKYKTSFSCDARLQEACYTLALLYNTRADGNPYHKAEDIRSLAAAACRFWAGLQAGDGSFDEYVKHEKSHVATAFSGYAVALTCQSLGIRDANISRALDRAALWLSRHDDPEVANHDAATIPFFHVMKQMTDDSRYDRFLKAKLDLVLKAQDPEGWFTEYGGADIGYQSFTIYFLAKYLSLSGDRRVLAPIRKAIDFLEYFIHPDMSAGGIYGSRGTNMILPAGIAMMMDGSPAACRIYQAILKATGSGAMPSPDGFDDRFTAQGLYPFIDMGGSESKSDSKPLGSLPCQGHDFVRHFGHAGLYVRKSGDAYLAVNLKLGGIGYLFSGQALARKFLPLSFERDGRTYSTYGRSAYSIEGDIITVDGTFHRYDHTLLSPIAAGGLFLLNSLGLGTLTKKMMRKRLIYHGRSGKHSFRRTFTLGGRISARDECGCREKPAETEHLPIFSTSTGFHVS